MIPNSDRKKCNYLGISATYIKGFHIISGDKLAV